MDKLAAYEASGLTPEEVMEYAVAKKDKRAFIIPFSVGDTVYVVTWLNGNKSTKLHEVVECKIRKILFRDDGKKISYTCHGRYANHYFRYCGSFILESIGNTVFFTIEEAVKKSDELNSKAKIKIPCKAGDIVFRVVKSSDGAYRAIKLTVEKVEKFGFTHNGIWAQVLMTDGISYECAEFVNFGNDIFFDEDKSVQEARYRSERGW